MPGIRETADNALRAWWTGTVLPALSVSRVFYQGWPESPPGTGGFLVFAIDWTTSTQRTLGRPGSRDYRFRGFVDIQVAGSRDDGTQPVLAIVDAIEAQALATRPAGVVLEAPTTERAITNGVHWIQSIRVPFWVDARA